MASHICPRCGKKGPVLLREGQVCHSCMSSWAWSNFENSNEQITISSETLAVPESKTPAPPPPAKASTRTWLLLVLSFVFSAVVIVLLVYFFRQPPDGLSGISVLNRFHTLALTATILALLAVVISGAVVFLAIGKRLHKQTAFIIAGAASIVLAMAVFVTAFVCWARTERVRYLSAEVPQTTGNEVAQRMQNATVVVQAHDPLISRYQSSKRAGIIIAAQSGRIFILTVPFFDAEGNGRTQPSDLWVNFTDGRTLPGRFRLATNNPISLAIVEVEGDKPPAEVQFHPLAEAIIPSQSVFVVPNPIHGWRFEQAAILTRLSQRTSRGWNCAVKVDLGLQPMDLGSAMYDESGRLLGMMAGFDEDGNDSEFVILDSATVAEIERLKQPGVERAQGLSRQEKQHE